MSHKILILVCRYVILPASISKRDQVEYHAQSGHSGLQYVFQCMAWPVEDMNAYSLFRDAIYPLPWFMAGCLLLLGRTVKMGLRNLVAAAAAVESAHGEYFLVKLYEELVDFVEEMEPGVSISVGGALNQVAATMCDAGESIKDWRFQYRM
ncbi:Uu.00g093900.m01.CDS01 [Anthostomella pinea]|uniref:Uu.00g093900.m01.CDS01 n=1 Tax=Anthostomella pinea TaxID=933095 RepID=A0AAI8YI77_9PEZI|nr:Uu.00g093900.m01.CDS01 [Anthostomella pinea]